MHIPPLSSKFPETLRGAAPLLPSTSWCPAPVTTSLCNEMTLRRAYGSYIMSGLQQDMAYGPNLSGLLGPEGKPQSCPRGCGQFVGRLLLLLGLKGCWRGNVIFLTCFSSLTNL